uniref:Uncharacterized protein n=1 Tax=Oryctolagus cuniculus TaxID=9986 RepID=A0A5F9C1U7_RABIT
VAAPMAAAEPLASGGSWLPVCVLMLGMPGSGKTFVQRLTGLLNSQSSLPYMINPWPAVCEVPFSIRSGDEIY